MLNTKSVREAMNELLKSDRQATKTALLSYTDRLLDKYTELSNKLTIIKNISSNWVASLVNRKAIRTLISKIREAKREINILINSYSSFRMNTNPISRIVGNVIIAQVNK